MKEFLDYLNYIIPFKEDAQSAIIAKLKKTKYHKGEILIKELSKCEHLFFIEKGLVLSIIFFIIK